MILFVFAIFIENTETKIIVFIFILCLSIQLQNDAKPFLTENLNYTERNACFSTFLIFLIKAFNYTMQGNIISEYACMILVLGLEVQFLYISLLNSFMIRIYSYVMSRQQKKKKISTLLSKLSKSNKNKYYFNSKFLNLESFVQEEYQEYIENFKNNDNMKENSVKWEPKKSVFVKMFSRVTSVPKLDTGLGLSPKVNAKKPTNLDFSENLKFSLTNNILALEELEITKLKGIIQDMSKKTTTLPLNVNEGKNIESVAYEDYIPKLEGDIGPHSFVLDENSLSKNSISFELRRWNYYFSSLELSPKDDFTITFSKSHANISENVLGVIEIQIDVFNISVQKISNLEITLKSSTSKIFL